MKKSVIFSTAIVALFSSCANDDDFVPASDEEVKYVEAFEKEFGKVPENQTWDFYSEYVDKILGADEASAQTRAPGRVHVTRRDNHQSSLDSKYWNRYLPEGKDNRNVGTRNFDLKCPSNGLMTFYAVWYGGWFENYKEYEFEFGVEVNGEKTKIFEGKEDTSPKSSDPKKFSSNPNYAANVRIDAGTSFRMYIKFKDDSGNVQYRYSDEGSASLVCTYERNKNKIVQVIGFEDEPESRWGANVKPDFNDAVIYIEGAELEPLLESKRFFCEDMGTIGDFDYNDIVFDVHPLKNGTTEVKVLAVGGTLPVVLSVGGQVVTDEETGETDLHEIFGSGHKQFNVGDGFQTLEPKTFIVKADIQKLKSFNDVKAMVTDHSGKQRIIRFNDKSSKGEAIISVTVNNQWMKEKSNIRKGYPKFFRPGWEGEPVENYLVDIK